MAARQAAFLFTACLGRRASMMAAQQAPACSHSLNLGATQGVGSGAAPTPHPAERSTCWHPVGTSLSAATLSLSPLASLSLLHQARSLFTMSALDEEDF
eukprot:CAMPEP_0119104860 /NCGR_PEP_ID=MMETSP1180-20130426/2960_1 /TAXON_ID=3052 ORGANISM="Chlamydomonas cf sp, Strain CCMP681" /NCGR_SAMPLE_ID=MMETSP1180 /ASSEMBLY_ACC=CAM_ASM_000741 /LENGTH=98 /DNA_ID=CAMNT_0007089719 /DNA_START=102 /DNA_END=398 /DNA_ORIENTATION=-